MSEITTPKGDTPHLPHLDGLRLVALAGVLLFHFKYPGAEGGFVGVDCFLVLSGFLITRNILSDIRAESFSVREFYIRRFWRLYPSSLLTVGLAVLSSYLFFTGDLAYETRRSAVASMFFVANFYFYREADYFDGDPQKKPLLHMWSLSLEEQFYCFWPLLLYVTANRKIGGQPVLSALVLLTLSISSFLFSMHMFSKDRSFSFYLLPCRIYEFGLGALLSICMESSFSVSVNSISSIVNFTCEVFSAASLVSVFSSFFLLQRHSSPLQTLPVLLAASVIIATPGSLVSRYVLSNPVTVFFGRLTYTGYLVHWTLYVFIDFLQSGMKKKSLDSLFLIPVTFSLAWVMKKTVEDKFRRNRREYTSILFMLLFITVISFSINGMSTNAKEVGQGFEPGIPTLCKDIVLSTTSEETTLGCMVGDLNISEPVAYVMGDSFAKHLIPAFDIIGKETKTKFRVLFELGCPLVKLDDPYAIRYCNPRCKIYNEKRWKIINGEAVEGYPPLPENVTILSTSLSRHDSLEERRISLDVLNSQLITKRNRLVIISEPPGLHESELWRYSCLELRKYPSRFWMRKTKVKCVSQWLTPRIESQRSLKYLVSLQKEINYGLINIFDPFCRKRAKNHILCKPLSHKISTRNDYKETGYTPDGLHLSENGSRYLVPFLYKQLLRKGVLPKDISD